VTQVTSPALLGHKRRTICAAGAIILVASACTLGGDNAQKPPIGAAEPPRGGTLSLSIAPGRLSELDPASYTGFTPFEVFRCCLLRTLFSYNGRPYEGGGSVARPDLAADAGSISDDGLVWTFRLKPGIGFAPPFQHTEIVAGDVIRAIERSVHPERSPAGYAFYFSVIQGVDDFTAGAANIISGLEAPDDYTLIVRLSEPVGDLPYRLSLPGTAPIPEGVPDGHAADYVRFLVASGPYMIEGSQDLDFSLRPNQQEPVSGFVPGEHISLVRNPSWEPSTDGLRPAYVDRIEFAFESERFGGDAMLGETARSVDRGDLDLTMYGLNDEWLQRYQDDPDRRIRLFVNVGNALIYMPINLAVPPLDDVHVRRAMSLAIDETRLVDLVWGGQVAARRGALHLVPDGLEEGLLAEYSPTWASGPGDDLAKARAEMRRSRYDHDGDGRCDGRACVDVPAFTVDYLPGAPRLVTQALAHIGVEVRFSVVNPSAIFGGGIVTHHAALGLADLAWSTDYPNGSSFIVPLFGREGLPPACCNDSLLGASPTQLKGWGYEVRNIPSVEDRIDRCLAQVGRSELECWADLDLHLMEDVLPLIPLGFLQSHFIVSERVVNYSFDQAFAFPALDRLALAPGSS